MFDWFNAINVRVYAAQQMTGVKQCVIYRRNWYCTNVLQKYCITVLSPVTEEGVKASNRKMDQPSQTQLAMYWRKDKFLIKNSHVLLDITGPSKSQGLLHEIGLSRYFLFKPIVRVMKLKGPSIAIEEDDLCVSTVEEAANLIIKEFGTPWKRLKWKFKLFFRCILPYLKTRLFWLFDWI
jgi:hypothetical protein